MTKRYRFKAPAAPVLAKVPRVARLLALAGHDTLLVCRDDGIALSERYRAVLVHCYLEGKTQEQVALLLRVSKATVKKRLERGRALLRARLVRCGLGPAAVLMACAWPAAMATAAVRLCLLDYRHDYPTGPAYAVPAKLSPAQCKLWVRIHKCISVALSPRNAAACAVLRGFSGE